MNKASEQGVARRHRLSELLRDGPVSSLGSALKIAAFGDSVTQGFTQVDTLEPDIVYHQKVKSALEAAHPGLEVEVNNAGLALDTATDALERLGRDVLSEDPDLVIVGFGLNDAIGLGSATGGLAGIDEFRRSLSAIIDGVHQHNAAQVILLTPNFMVSRDDVRHIAEKERAYLPLLLPVQRDGVVAAYADAARQVGAAKAVPVADVYQAWARLEAEGRDTNELLANGLNHPGAEGHELTAELILAELALLD
ncbi:MAG TPA: GDSL-type esterase/lipase family protein [Trueperaceae bacterium]|nr:GDSL-type esterase/lipase family protein [Trueperaceae bacterium]